jgi:hypothetical protein
MGVDNSSAVSATGESMSTAYPDGVDNSSAVSATEESMSTVYPDVPTIGVASLEQPTSGVSQTAQVTSSTNGKYVKCTTVNMLNVQSDFDC